LPAGNRRQERETSFANNKSNSTSIISPFGLRVSAVGNLHIDSERKTRTKRSVEVSS
jgi:hypothetical protein